MECFVTFGKSSLALVLSALWHNLQTLLVSRNRFKTSYVFFFRNSSLIKAWAKTDLEYSILERTANEAHVKRLFSSESRIALRGLNLQKKLRKKKNNNNKNTKEKKSVTMAIDH